MRIAVFSDIHGNLEALEAILESIKKDTFDEIIYLGDAIGLGPNPKECLNLLADSNIRWLLGNHDLYFKHNKLDDFDIEEEKKPHYKWVWSNLDENDRKKLKDKETEYVLNINNKILRFSHYFIKNRNSIYPFYSIKTIKEMKILDLLNVMNADYIFYGHDHKHQEYKFNDKYLIDVGSSGCVKEDTTFYTIIEIDNDIKYYVKEIKYNRNKLEQKIKDANYENINMISNNFFGIKKDV